MRSRRRRMRSSAKASSRNPPIRNRNSRVRPKLRRTWKPGRAGPRSPEHEFKECSLMPLSHNALVLVADGRKMLFFRNHGDESHIDLRTESHDARRYQRKDREIKTDAPGTTKQSLGFGRSTYEEN